MPIHSVLAYTGWSDLIHMSPHLPSVIHAPIKHIHHIQEIMTTLSAACENSGRYLSKVICAISAMSAPSGPHASLLVALRTLTWASE